MNEGKTIGQAAKELGVNIQTLRYYERRRILEKPKRTPSGYRVYTKEAIQRIDFIKKAQVLGFTLKEITDLLKLKVTCSTNNKKIRTKAEDKLRIIQDKIRHLKGLERTLKGLIQTCQKQGTTGPCPILKSLA